MLERIERRQQRRNQRAVIGVVAVGTIERHARHAAAVDLQQNRIAAVRCRHGGLLSRGADDTIAPSDFDRQFCGWQGLENFLPAMIFCSSPLRAAIASAKQPSTSEGSVRVGGDLIIAVVARIEPRPLIGAQLTGICGIEHAERLCVQIRDLAIKTGQLGFAANLMFDRRQGPAAVEAQPGTPYLPTCRKSDLNSRHFANGDKGQNDHSARVSAQKCA